MSLSMIVTTDGMPEFLLQLRNAPKAVGNAAYGGLMSAAQKMVDQAKINASQVFHKRSGRLYDSIKILESEDSLFGASVTIGSDLPGYPFYQEVGYTAKLPSGFTKDIPPKFYILNAIIQVASEVPDLIATVLESEGDVL
jgi:hypothetical protein